MYCPNCGTKLDDNSIFCTECGKKVNETPPQTTQQTIEQTPPTVSPSPTQEPPAPTYPQAQPIIQTPLPRPKPIIPPKPPKPPKEKKERKTISKKTVVTILLSLILTLVISSLAALPFAVLNREETVTVSTLFDDDVFGYFTLRDFMSLLTQGNKIFHPTLISSAIGISIYIFTYAVPIFACISLISSYFNKKSVPLHVLSCIVSGVYALLISLAAPLSVMLIPELKRAIASSINVIPGDVGSVYSTSLPIVAGIVVALIVISSILVGIIRKRRTK